MQKRRVLFFAGVVALFSFVRVAPADAFCRAKVTPNGTCDSSCSGTSGPLSYWNTRHINWVLYKDPAAPNEIQPGSRGSTRPER
jgi:hypothetical protein